MQHPPRAPHSATRRGKLLPPTPHLDPTHRCSALLELLTVLPEEVSFYPLHPTYRPHPQVQHPPRAPHSATRRGKLLPPPPHLDPTHRCSALLELLTVLPEEVSFYPLHPTYRPHPQVQRPPRTPYSATRRGKLLPPPPHLDPTHRCSALLELLTVLPEEESFYPLHPTYRPHPQVQRPPRTPYSVTRKGKLLPPPPHLDPTHRCSALLELLTVLPEEVSCYPLHPT